MKNLILIVAKEMKIQAERDDNGNLIFRRGNFRITPKGGIWEEYDALNKYMTEIGDAGAGLDTYMQDTKIAHDFAEIVKSIEMADTVQ